jgi:hypothetical protein
MIAALVVTCVLLQAQQPPRDRPAPTGQAHGSISGRILAADGKTTLRRAIVRVSSPALPRRLTVRAAIDGTYSLTGLPAGRYTVSAQKSGYLSLEYGQRRPGEPGRLIDLQAGQRLGGVDILLPPAASIAGVIVDELGEPVYQMWVAVGRRTFQNGKREYGAVRRTVTNDAGQFRLSGLPPGDYVLMATQRDARIHDAADEPLAFAPTFYPGVTSISMAQPIRLAVGEQVTQLGFQIMAVPTATVRGRVVTHDGQPFSGRISVIDGADVMNTNGIIGGATVTSTGEFRITGFPPGLYTLTARGTGPTIETPIDVRGGNVSGLVITVGPGATVNGRVVTASGAPLPPIPAIQIQAPAFGNSPGVGNANIAADGTFRWSSVVGRRVVRAASLPAGWWLRSVLLNDQEITDTPVEFTHGQVVDGLRVVLDDRSSQLSGSVRNTDGTAVSDYTIVVFSTDSSRWGQHSRFIRSARPDHTGRFSVAGLPPGDYHAIAVDFVETGEWLDPDWLNAARGSATTIALDQQQPATVQLSLTPAKRR